MSQSAVLSATYRQYARRIHPDINNFGYIIHDSPLLPNSRRSYVNKEQADSRYTPITPRLDLVNQIQSPRAAPRMTSNNIDPFSRRIAFEMTAVMRDTQTVMLAGIRILDMNGVVVAGQEETGLSLAHVEEVRQALSGQYASTIRQRISDEPPPPLYSISRGTNIRVFSAFPVIEGNRLIAVIYLSRTPKNIIKHLYLVQNKIYVATITLLLVAILLVLFVSSSISRPIRELIEQIQRVTRGEQTQIEPIKHPVSHEVAQLSESFSSMSRTLTERADYINRFATHVSHEFKTPLTSMQGALELLQEHIDTMPAEKRHHFMGNLLDDTQRLKKLVSRLLELARADALEPSNQRSSLAKQLDSMRSRYKDRGLSVRYDTLPDISLAIAPDALETVLNNLMENSLQHGADTLNISADSDENLFQLTLHDNGKGISKANRDKIFTPFFTTRRNTGGTGLGLEIISSLLKAHQGEIKLGDTEEGAEFIIILAHWQPSIAVS
ncbi:MAG: Two-component sensor histidine kinase [uncultured Thiotrichaceae bacterium]|uniref:histidine kinase n=1 Tax=uncultured Thiotrichaceae bacterium TaxID=298394 RepID=A0A6S6T438_9GAMM|nr:MAG: Two-component sensor histidine kinase [uncultured Thiotrichaceae bacterium]